MDETRGETCAHTKIVATLGPTSASDGPFSDLALLQGVDCLRYFNSPTEISNQGSNEFTGVRELAPTNAIMVDIPGPKIRTRVDRGRTQKMLLTVGDEIDLVEGQGEESTDSRIVVEKFGVTELLKIGDKVHIGDGGISLDVIASGPTDARRGVSSEVSLQASQGFRFRAPSRRSHFQPGIDQERQMRCIDEGLPDPRKSRCVTVPPLTWSLFAACFRVAM